MNAETLLELAARCEAAEAGDRHLDADIAVAVFGLIEREAPADHQNARQFKTADMDRTIDLDDWSLFGVEVRPLPDMSRAEGWTVFDIPPFSASLDAAMTLMPAGASVSLSWSREWPEQDKRDWCAKVNSSRHVWARTPALALTAACLRARAAAEQAS